MGINYKLKERAWNIMGTANMHRDDRQFVAKGTSLVKMEAGHGVWWDRTLVVGLDHFLSHVTVLSAGE